METLDNKEQLGLGVGPVPVTDNYIMNNSPVCVSQCSVENAPTTLVKGTVESIFMQVRDASGDRIRSPQEIKARIRKPDTAWVEIEVEEKNDKTFINVLGCIEGVHQGEITVAGQHFPGSPFEFSVVRGMVRTFGAPGRGEGQFRYPWGITVDRNGDVITADRYNDRLQILDKNGNCKKLITFSQFQHPFKPGDITISDDNHYFSLDYINKQVVVSDDEGTFIRSFGKEELKDPYGIAISPIDGAVYVSDWEGYSIRIYNQFGIYTKSFGGKGKKEGQFLYPSGIAFNGDGLLFVSDNCNHRVQVFDVCNQFLYSFGCYGSNNGEFNCPKGLAIDAEGHIYVSDYNRIQKFTSSGRFLSRVDRDSDGISLPTCIAVTSDDPQKVLVVDSSNHCIKVFVE
ncbi:uncharacterized protein LOC102807645 [Saccoglossus kowalevskii]|uniref:Protein lin-41-like n=1 Tax=Saccoglossus kowalevskii TaxID=10224 RepID=A0ABM0M3H5_SACKO|nr:PREDICTED: protein lin-41-like [Saccoglossus kowalevskii]